MSTKGKPDITKFSLRRLLKAGANNPRVASPAIAKRYKLLEILAATSVGIAAIVFWQKN